jgi:gliding motility-associated-like protein
MRILYSIFTLFVLTLSLNAQNEGNIWHFGYQYGLDFSNGDPVLTLNSNMYTFEGCASYCDTDGNLLFYSNGGGRTDQDPNGSISSGGIWNRNNDLMHDMMGIQGGGYSASQSCIIIPNPANADQYYLFTMEEGEYSIDGIPPGQEDGRGLRYFIVDMTLNGGLGGLVEEDVSVYAPSFESIDAALHANGTDYWIIIRDWVNDNYFVYLLDETGLTGPTQYPRASISSFAEVIKVSPDRALLFEGRVLYDFDAGTGAITNPRTLLNGDYVGSSFSHNSRYLYVVADGDNNFILKRFDVSANNIAATEEEIYTLEQSFTGQLQLAPDGRIYWNVFTAGKNTIFTIDCPNSEYPTVVESAFVLPPDPNGYGVFFSLPNFTDHIFVNDIVANVDLGDDMTIDCEEYPILLDAQNPGSSYLWSTGETTQTINVSQSGLYRVTVTTECGIITDEIAIEDNNILPTIAIDGEEILCPESKAELIGTSNESVSYQWSTGDNTSIISIDQPGTYVLTITDNCGGQNTDSIEVSLLEESVVLLDGIFSICEGTSTVIDATSPGATAYSWSTGDDSPSATITSGGDYSLTITNVCEALDTSFFVEETALPVIAIQSDAVLCPGEEKLIETFSESISNYQWSTGQTTPSIIATDWNLYIVEGSNECGSASDSLLLQPQGCDNCLYIPNAFSPNFDGRNDSFSPIAVCQLENFEMKIFSRWGALVYQTSSPDDGWDGTFKGQILNTGVFIWMISYKQGGQTIHHEGDVVLLR